MKKTRAEREAELLARDRELMAQMKADPDNVALLRERTLIKSQMNLYGPAAVARLREQDFKKFTDLVAEQEAEREEASRAFGAKNPELQEKIRNFKIA